MNMPDLNVSNLVATGTTGFILIASLIYKIVKKINSDIRDNKSLDTFDNYRDSLMSRLKELEDRNDQLVKERSEINELKAKDEYEIKCLSEEIQELKRSNKELREGIKFLLDKAPLTPEDLKELYKLISAKEDINDDNKS